MVTRLLARLPKYNNLRSEWSLFKFFLRTYFSAVNGNLLRHVMRSEGRNEPLNFPQMTEEELTIAQTVMYILANYFTGSPLQLAMNIESMNGLAARRLQKPHDGAMWVATFMDTLRTNSTGGMSTLVYDPDKLEISREQCRGQDLP